MAILTEREREVAWLVARGFGDIEIAARLHISRQTVRSHMKHIYEKAGIRGNRVLLALAMVEGTL